MANLTPDQVAVAKAILRRAQIRHAGPKKRKAAIETALVESNLSNPAGGDGTSVGWRQETASSYPGANRRNVAAAADRFFSEADQLNRPGISAGELAARVQRPAAQYRGRYEAASAQADAILRQLGMGGGAAASPAGGLQHVDIANQQSFDTAGFQDAQHKQILAQLLTRHGQGGSALFKTGLLSTAAPNPADFSSSTLTSRIVQDAPSGARAPSAPSVRISGRTGKVVVAAGANRAGVGISPLVTRFIRDVAGLAGRPLTIGTGTNHDRMTTTGNVSDHWDGHAADVPASGVELTKLGQQALIAAGMAPGRARQQKGGVYNLQHDGHRVQILFNTNVGGNHYNHLHVGIR